MRYESVTFTVEGVPIPKGSMKAFNVRGRRHPVVTHDNPRTRPWSAAVAWAARVAWGSRPKLLEGVELGVVFYLPRPKSAPKAVREPLKKPDLDKLTRCVKDSLTRAGVYADDSQVIKAMVEKCFAGATFDGLGGEGNPRAVIRVSWWAE